MLKEIDNNSSNYYIIHYSCESFYDIKDGRTPRVTSIAIRSYDTGQTDSFSIHKMAEKKRIPLKSIVDCYDELELGMLEEYFEFVRQHQKFKWIHWNMRDINFGFKAIEHRFEVLGGNPVIIPEANKIDMSRLLIGKYGVAYIGHPRMESLIAKNHIHPKDYLSGAQEAEAFERQEYIKLHQSTLRKVDLFANLLERTINNSLLTNSRWFEIYGLSPQGIFEYTQSNWIIRILLGFLTLVIGAIIAKLLT